MTNVQRIVFALRYADGLTVKEIEGVLDLPRILIWDVLRSVHMQLYAEMNRNA